MSTWTDSGLNDPDYAAPATRGTLGSRRRIRLRGEHLARAADHRWPSNHAHYMPEPCAEILTEWLYPLAEDYLALAAERDEWKDAAERATANAERLLWALESIPRDKLPIRDRVALIAALESPLAASPVPEEQP